MKQIIRKLVPGPGLYELVSMVRRAQSIPARKALRNAPQTVVWLEAHELKALQEAYPSAPEYGYDPDSLERRGTERAGGILSLLPAKGERARTFLELGCLDGMVCCALQRMGKTTTGIDCRSEGFDERAVREGVKLLEMDAAHLEFGDETFDFVFSYDAFEHFADPESVLREATRVVEKGGHIYLDFGPLYMSPLGLHAYRSITVPYCQFLFPRKLLKDFVEAKGLRPIDFTQVNGWTLENWRKLWTRYSGPLKRISYRERVDVSGRDLIVKYPSCFRSKCKSFESLTISSIEVLFRRIR